MLISLADLVAKFKLKLKGIIHLGAHECEELKSYNDNGVKIDKVLWIEGNKDLVEKMKNVNKDLILYNAVIADVDNKEFDFIITNNYQSSSILELEDHKIHHPQVVEKNRYKVKSQTLDSFIKNNGIDASKYNMINIDIQGAELLALKGAKNLLNTIDYLYLEVNTAHLYKDCALVGEIDEYLSTYGFNRVETSMTEYNWGDAFYIKNVKVNYDIICYK
jgi:FkbM family methyltransferase